MSIEDSPAEQRNSATTAFVHAALSGMFRQLTLEGARLMKCRIDDDDGLNWGPSKHNVNFGPAIDRKDMDVEDSVGAKLELKGAETCFASRFNVLVLGENAILQDRPKRLLGGIGFYSELLGGGGDATHADILFYEDGSVIVSYEWAILNNPDDTHQALRALLDGLIEDETEVADDGVIQSRDGTGRIESVIEQWPQLHLLATTIP